MALGNTPFDERITVLLTLGLPPTACWLGLPLGLPWKATDWKIKDIPFWAWKLRKQIMVTEWAMWVTHIDDREKSPFSNENNWNPASDWAWTIQIATIAA